ncbi:MAG: 2-oxoacid:acceptor oxidoreductase subunit alpha [Rhodospirillales bacterium]|jgi:2-oxoglutarate ferredoxin oxidoreductase subunit alpha|nr:2-oxoacid:acceptor oxidoreductase subunit alpha [Rhodospirillales bacterium]MDP6643348.1 2-oxoacid:acceptor oxidoreductase subunit alpha [Rhodospirillales bacterium]MDP6840040.1 2-oxoacid:acceptor oxidoreductase subunit alpha [Rhodospirillales bacterium]|tara:strand:- start:651 stop:1787 length:1137 start_codon:yes stop_codon:yes gene_type:complete
MSGNFEYLHGNHACAVAAVTAGCRFFAGYPITPSSEIAERMSKELPAAGGTFIQMEDEMGSLAAVIGASVGGVKAMTATSGPGFSLKQENLGYASLAEVPCVIINVSRGGPSTGMPTRPAQADIMQSRWGSHGDHPVIVITPDSVKEIYNETIRAFDLSEKLRIPVVLMFDQAIGHLQESVEVAEPEKLKTIERKWVKGDEDGFEPYAATKDAVPPMARPGDGQRVHMTGLTHAESGYPTQDPDTVRRNMERLLSKLEINKKEIEKYECIETVDAEYLIVTIGISARAARQAVKSLRRKGVKAGLFRPITLWPFPEEAFREAAANAKAVLVPEMNAGQLVLEIERLCSDASQVAGLNKIDGEPISPAEIVAKLEELIK